MTNSRNIIDHLLLVGLIVALFCGIGIIWYYQKVSPPIENRSSLSSFWNLKTVLWQNGKKAYFAEKSSLKKAVKYSLENKKIEARNVALYLFPELLDDDDFEKFEAENLWLEHQKFIEKNPHTKLSRKKFKEMEANIWNFENPSKDEPQLSEFANEVVRIFNILSNENEVTKN